MRTLPMPAPLIARHYRDGLVVVLAEKCLRSPCVPMLVLRVSHDYREGEHNATPDTCISSWGPGRPKLIQEPTLHLTVVCRASCETQKSIVVITFLSAVQGR